MEKLVEVKKIIKGQREDFYPHILAPELGLCLKHYYL